MQRKTFLALTGGTLVSAGTGWKAWAQGKQPEKPVIVAPKRSNTYTPKKPQELAGPIRQRYGLIEERPGVRVYSPYADEIRAAAFAGEIEWVATPHEIRRVDRKRNEVRVYSTDDGLPPSELLALVGDEQEAFALTMDSAGMYLLCFFDAAKQLWQTAPLEKFPFGYVNNAMVQGKSLLVLGERYVACIPWYNELRNNQAQGRLSPFMVFDRKSRKVTSGAWDPAILADQRHLEVWAVALVGETLWLGTQIGVLGAPLRASETPLSWERWLPDRAIHGGTKLSEGRLVLATTDRDGDNNPCIETLDLKTGKATALPHLTERVDGYRLANAQIIATSDTTLWFVGALGLNVQRLSPGKTAWEKVACSDALPGRPSMFSGVMPKLADEKTLPDVVAGAIACQVRRSEAYSRNATSEVIGQEFWLQQRFWRWCSPDHSAELPDELQGRFGGFG
uniref:hypothetical protein n=1 Tax=Armatimonas sp. TaxID=1872638 RepID=UPI00286C82BA